MHSDLGWTVPWCWQEHNSSAKLREVALIYYRIVIVEKDAMRRVLWSVLKRQ